MYTMVLMMAATTGGDTASFGGLRGGCHGSSSCHGAPVVVAAPAGCYGSSYTGGCYGSSSCIGSSSCHGDRGGFLGLRNRGGNGCNGDRGGFLGHKNRGGCHGTSSCHGVAVAAPVCCPAPAPTCCPAPAPACGGCGAPVAACGGCGTAMATAPMMTGMPVMMAPEGCPPATVIVGTPTTPATTATPAVMPKPMGETPVKKEEPKKQD